LGNAVRVLCSKLNNRILAAMRPPALLTCVVVRHGDSLKGKLHEVTLDYFAQHKDGSVWYFGEDVQKFDRSGKTVINADGSWLAGVNGAEPGIIMLATRSRGCVQPGECAGSG
jgi:hypothetical protein